MKFKDKMAAHIVMPKNKAKIIKDSKFKTIMQFEKESATIETAIAEVKKISYSFRESALPESGSNFPESGNSLCGRKEVNLFTEALGCQHSNTEVYYFQSASADLQFIWVESLKLCFVRLKTCDTNLSTAKKDFIANHWHPEVLWQPPIK